MEQTNTHTAGDSNSDRRVDSSRWRAEAADEQARQRSEQARQEEEEVQEPQVVQAQREQPFEPAQADTATDPLWQRWWEIQSNFVDDPRSSVAEAHALVSGIVDRVVHQLEEQRRQLEQSWSNGNHSSTDDLRRNLQSYREFLGRLLSRSEEPRNPKQTDA